jgi:phosphoglycolate phosphatase
MEKQKVYKACIFDLDGTLANTLVSIASFANDALKFMGLPSIETEDYKTLVGNGADTLMRRMANKVGADLSEEQLSIMRKEYDRLYESDPMHLVACYPGIPEMLQTLRKKGYRLGVLSNKPDNMTKYIAGQLYPNLLDKIQGQQAGVPKKPDPTALLHMAEELGVSPKDILYVGDSSVDMDTGKNAGMDTCGVLWGFRSKAELEAHGAVYLAETAEQLFRIITGTQEETACR